MEIINGLTLTSKSIYQLNVINLLKHAVRNFGRQEILSRRPDGTLFRYTYQDAYERVQRLANSLHSLGIQPGDRIGVLTWNTHENFEIYFGLPGIGAVMLLLNARLVPSELEYIIKHAEAKFLIVDDSLLSIAEEIIPSCKTIKGCVIITEKQLSSITTQIHPKFSYEELLYNANPSYDWPQIDENSIYSACYTTGTTGKPKGVYSSHREVYLQALMYAINARFSVNDCIFQIVPMYHVLGWGTPQAAILVGAKIVLPGNYNLSNVSHLIDIVIREKVTVFNGATAFIMPMLEFIQQMDPKPDFSNVQFICGASEPPLELIKSYKELTGAEIIHTYGSTEAMAIVTINQPKPWLENELTEGEKWELKRKQGYVVVGLDVKIINPEGADLPNDGKSTGEILIRGPWVTSKYYNSPGTENQFTEDGYWKSGDVGYLDSEGYLKITDRLKDIIKSGGEWISTINLENTISSLPNVLEAAVVGIPHPKWQERPLALVVPRNNQVTKKQILESLKTKFAKWQLPDKILFVHEIPKTSVGKIDKKNIRKAYRNVYKENYPNN